MDKPLELERVKIDPSPFQLVERTSLHKVSLPSLILDSLPVGFLPLINGTVIVYVQYVLIYSKFQ